MKRIPVSRLSDVALIQELEESVAQDCLEPGGVDELLTAATHRTRGEIEQLMAERFPKPDMKAAVRAIPPAPAQPLTLNAVPIEENPNQPQLIANTESELSPGKVGGPVILGLGHEVPRSDLAEVFVRALKAYAAVLEKRKHAATENPRAPRRQEPGSRHISAHVKRAVRKRDKGQCTYVSESGHRCEARSDLEYDRTLEYARGGEATVSNIRLRCRAHNQLTAEHTFGAGFMLHKRERATDGMTSRSSPILHQP